MAYPVSQARFLARLAFLGWSVCAWIVCSSSALAQETSAQSPPRAGYSDGAQTKPASGSLPMPAPSGRPGAPASQAIDPAKITSKEREGASGVSSDTTLLPIDLPWALRLVNTSNPTIGFAQERVREAYARLGQADVLWIPNLWLGGNPDNLMFLPNFYVHQGNISNARGDIFETVRANGAFSTGTGINLSISEAIFAPRIARDMVAAEQARSRAVTFNIQLDVALAYLDLLQAYGELAINAEILSKAELMAQFAIQAEREGLGKTTADANRARAEVERRKRERIDIQGRAAVASARLAQLLLLEATADLVPADKSILPIELVCAPQQINDLVAVALMNRPELAENRSLIAAALTQWRQDKTRPLIPTLQMAYYRGEFGGGMPAINEWAGRNDFYIQASWQLRSAGLGNLYQTRAARSRLEQANLRLIEVQAQVAAEVAASAKLVRVHEQALASAQEAVRQAEEMWTRLSKAAFGLAGPARKYDPLEPILAEQELNTARLAYLAEVISYNREQFRLFWALGQPPEAALPKAQAKEVKTSVLPPPEPAKKPQ